MVAVRGRPAVNGCAIGIADRQAGICQLCIGGNIAFREDQRMRKHLVHRDFLNFPVSCTVKCTAEKIPCRGSSLGQRILTGLQALNAVWLAVGFPLGNGAAGIGDFLKLLHRAAHGHPSCLLWRF